MLSERCLNSHLHDIWIFGMTMTILLLFLVVVWDFLSCYNIIVIILL